MSAYQLLLLKHGLLPTNASSADSFGMWMRLCSDPVVIQRSQKKAAGKRPAYLESVHSSYSHGAKVLQSMNRTELQALRDRLGVRPTKEFAVQK